MTAMATATTSKKGQKVSLEETQALKEWTKLFPQQATETYTSSVTFMKQLTVVAVSTVTYLKNAFSEDNYNAENFGGLKIRVLKNKCNDELAQFLSNAMVQAFEAFEKKYLHQLAVCFYDGESKLENLIEYHIFEYSYKPDGMSMSLSSKGRDGGSVSKAVTITMDNVRERTMQLIRACVVAMEMMNKQPLPDSCDVSVRLYYNEDAPEGYQAPGFVAGAATEDPLGHTYGDLLKLGRVETPFHTLVMRTYLKDAAAAPASNEPIPSENPPVMTQAPDDLNSSLTRARSRSHEQRSASTSSSVQVRCVCNNYDKDELGALLVCMYCNRQQHATCYGIPAGRANIAHHCCVACSDEDSTRTPTDVKVASVVPKKRQCFAIFRRALELCARNENVSTTLLCDGLGLSQLSAVKLMKLLQNSGIIERNSQDGVKTSSKIDHNRLKTVTNQYFQTGEETIVDRLLAETFNSQNSQSNPVEAILSPLEKVNLQNASQIGRVVENCIAVETPNSEDPIMRQYRNAMILVEKYDNIEKATDVVGDMDKMRKRGVKRQTGEKELATGVSTKKAKVPKKKK